MPAIPTNIDAPLTRRATAAALTEAGFPIAYESLATMASRGTGPPYYRFGPRALYRWRDALKWAEAKMGEPRTSPAEARARALALGKSEAKAGLHEARRASAKRPHRTAAE
jgi:hypothetical protein